MTWDFAGELDRWGPAALRERSASPEEARAYCQDLATTHYENFPVASFLVPAHLRRPIEVIYRFARSADDIADEGDTLPHARLAALAAEWGVGRQVDELLKALERQAGAE